MGRKQFLVGIVGGRGKMGSWLSRILQDQGMTVLHAGRHTPLTPAELARRCRVVVISVPIDETEQVVREIGPLVEEESLLMDLTSVKKRPLELMLKHCRAGVVGAHPLFGPEGRGSGTVVLCPGRGRAWLQWVKDIFTQAGLNPVVMDPGQHDRVMGVVQAVNHFSNLALALAIRKSGLSGEDLQRCSTPSFRSRMEGISRLLDDSPALVWDLQAANPYAAESRKNFMEAAEELSRIIHAGQASRLGTILASLRSFFRVNPKGEWS